MVRFVNTRDPPFLASLVPAATPGFWDVPESYFVEAFVADNVDWDLIEIVEEPVDFSAPETTFSDPFDAPPWDLIEIVEEPVDFSAAETTFTEPFDVPPWDA